MPVPWTLPSKLARPNLDILWPRSRWEAHIWVKELGRQVYLGAVLAASMPRIGSPVRRDRFL